MSPRLITLTIFILILLTSVLCTPSWFDPGRKREQLNYKTEAVWKWHQEDQRIQIGKPKMVTLLRKVYLDEKKVIFTTINDDQSLMAMAIWYVKCQPKTRIVTSKKFPSGEPKVLECTESGDRLTFTVSWPKVPENYIWEEDLDGFKIHEYFEFWDFTPLQQEATLRSSK